jgi:hypothetical protein
VLRFSGLVCDHREQDQDCGDCKEDHGHSVHGTGHFPLA